MDSKMIICDLGTLRNTYIPYKFYATGDSANTFCLVSIILMSGVRMA